MEAKIEQPQMGLTFEDVWAAIMKTQETIEKSQIESEKSKAEFDARLEKSQIEFEKSNAEFDARLEKSKAEFDAQLKSMREEFKISQARIDAIIDRTQAQVDKTAASVDKLSKNLGGIGESLGALIETLISAKLWEKFDAYNYNFKRAYRRIPLYDENSKILTDIDILLSDGGYAMSVETKREFDKEKDVDHHLKRMELIKKYPPAECKGKKLLGAIAGGTVDPDVAKYAHSAGLFVLEMTGESVQLVKTPDGFSARQW